MKSRTRRARGFSETRVQSKQRQEKLFHALRGDPHLRHRGRVVRMEMNRFGFIVFEGVHLFFHHSQVSGLVTRGDMVSFCIAVDPHDPSKCGAVDVQLS